MKSWAKKPFTKAALSVIAVGMSIIVCLSGVMLIYKINDSEGKVVGVGESSYEESGAFEQRMGDASRNVLERIRVKEQLEADGKYDPNRLVDVIAYDKDGKISGKNESGLAYRLSDIAEWGMKYNQSDLSAENAVVCEKTDGTYHYYYMDEFKNLLKWGVPMRQAVKSVTINPARAIRADRDTGSITAGKLADLVALDDQLNIRLVMVQGQIKVNNL